MIYSTFDPSITSGSLHRQIFSASLPTHNVIFPHLEAISHVATGGRRGGRGYQVHGDPMYLQPSQLILVLADILSSLLHMPCENAYTPGALTNVAVEVDDTDRPPPTKRRPQRCESSGVIASEGYYSRYI